MNESGLRIRVLSSRIIPSRARQGDRVLEARINRHIASLPVLPDAILFVGKFSGRAAMVFRVTDSTGFAYELDKRMLACRIQPPGSKCATRRSPRRRRTPNRIVLPGFPRLRLDALDPLCRLVRHHIPELRRIFLRDPHERVDHRLRVELVL